MKKKTREHIDSLKRAVEIENQLPWSCAWDTPEHDLVTALWRARDEWSESLVQGLKSYQIPETASLFARGQFWDGQEDAYILPGGLLLVRWDIPSNIQIMTEAEFLHALAERSVDRANEDADADSRTDLIRFCRDHLRRNP